ncbi:MAG: hypothetical protein LUE16_01905 [Lachnospiraceae bacterium]|nr:hypothetical protein [Lachnospiraceae bacterium]
MIKVLFNWIYILFTTFCLGFGFSAFGKKILRYEIRRLENILLGGMILATVYAQVFSLFAGVGFGANVGLILICVALIFAFHQEMMEFLQNKFKSHGIAYRLAVFALFLLWAYFTSRGTMIYDSDLYHAQSIRWIEEYGVVKGLGNLHLRYAYNSSVFCAAALYSMKFVFGQSMHTLSGYFAFLLSISVLRIGKCVRRRKLLWSDFARIAAAYYMTRICDEVVSPASDYPAMRLVFLIVTAWLEQLESDEKDEIAPYALLCVAGVYAVSVKVTVGLLLLLVIRPAYLLIRQKRVMEIFLYIGMGVLILAPWMTRTVLISGYLLYPYPALDLFDVDWKIPAYLAERDAAEIKVYGRNLYFVEYVDTPLSEWFPQWLNAQQGAARLMILADIASVGLLILGSAVCLIKRAWRHLDSLLVMWAVSASYLLWQLSAPVVRYGYAYILLTPVLMAGCMAVVCLSYDRKILNEILLLPVAAFGCYIIYTTAVYAWQIRLDPYYIAQQDYGSSECEAFEVGGVTFYRPLYEERVGYDIFPVVFQGLEFELRGESIEDGFRSAMPDEETYYENYY